MTTIAEIIQLNRAVTSVGGRTPKAVTDLLATWDAACDAADALGGNTLPELLATGKLTAKTAQALVTDAANRVSTHTTAVDLVREMQPHITHAAVQALQGQAGEELVESLRPSFNAAAAAIAATPFSPDDARNPAKILTLGDEASQAWRELPTHAHTLNTIYRNVLIPLVARLDVLPDHGWNRPEARFVPFVIDGNHKANIFGAAQVFASSSGTGEPGGGWHRLHSAGYRLRLNSPAEASELVEQFNAGLEADAQRHRKLEAEATEEYRKRFAVAGRR